MYSTPCGVTIYEAKFQNSDGSTGVMAGPHPSFQNDWEQVGQVVYTYEVMPEVNQYRKIHQVGMNVPLLGFRERFESSDDDTSDVSKPAKDVNVLTTRRPPKVSQRFDKIENAGAEITYRCKDCRNCPECKKSDRFESICI